MNNQIAIAALSVLILLGTAAVFWLDGNALRSELARSNDTISALREQNALLNATIRQKDADLTALTAMLHDTGSRLNETASRLERTGAILNATTDELNRTQEALEEKGRSLEETRQEFVSLQQNLTGMEESINQSIQWFRDNSRLTPSLAFFNSYLVSHCVENKKLNLACVSMFMERRLGIEYLSEGNDRLYSLDEIVARGGGDCEDYSLFLKAVLNDLSGESFGLLSWTPGDDRFTVYSTSSRYWYYEGSGINLGKSDSVHPYSFCYVTGMDGEIVNGHCIVALAKADIQGNVSGLDGADTFEPQNGGYTGRIGERFHICTNGDAECEKTQNSVIIVMTDEDIFEFRDGSWQSLAGFRDKSQSLRQKLSAELG